MRLAQIARKVGMTPQEVRRFLENEFELNIGNEPNYKLDASQVVAVLAEFPIPEVIEEPVKTIAKALEIKENSIIEEEESVVEVIEEEATIFEEEHIESDETIQEIQAEESLASPVEESEIDAISAVEEDTHAVITEEEVEEVINESITSPKEAKVVEIDYQREEVENTENQNFQEVAVDRNAELIKAPTVKLDGLKILGKIELPSAKKVEDEVNVKDPEEKESDVLAELDAAMQSHVQDIKPSVVIKPTAPEKIVQTNDNIDESEEFSIYKDKRGNYRFTLEQRANRAKSLAGGQERKKLEAEKEKKRRHYEKIAAQRKEALNTGSSKKEKSKKVVAREHKKQIAQKPKPTTLWGKFVHWLND